MSGVSEDVLLIDTIDAKYHFPVAGKTPLVLFFISRSSIT